MILATNNNYLGVAMLKFTKLTRINMRKLTANEKLNEHGIVFERLANGDGRFTINIMVDGQRIHHIIGKESDGTTRTQAEEFIQKAKQDAKTGRLNLPKGRKIIFSFKEAAKQYLDKQKIEGAKNLKAKTYQLNLHLIPFFNEMLLNKISSFDIERYKKLRLDSKARTGTINRELAVLSHLFTKSLEWGWVEKKPSSVKRFKEEKSRIIYLNVEQIDRLVKAAKQDDNSQIFLFILIGLETAMRYSEILAIRLEHIDLEKRAIYIPQAKAGARQQPITLHLVEFLKSYLAQLQTTQIWLFPSTLSVTGHTININKPFRRVVKAAGLDSKQVVRHTLRHTAITHLVQAGIDLPTVKRISGHKTLQMVERYSHQNGEHIQAAMDKLEQRYRNSNAS
jgi:integrase